MSDFQALEMIKAEHIYVDGTFYVAPKGKR